MPAPPRWRPPWLWRLALVLARWVIAPVARLRVEGGRPAGPVILAANHISPFDPMVLAAACRVKRLAPRILATGGLFRAPVVGALMRWCGHIPVHRGTARVTTAVPAAAEAVGDGATILLYPEGRIGLDPGMWPERGRTGAARIALTTGVPVVPVAQWGAHTVVPYAAPRGLLRAVPRALRRRPVIQVRFGRPVDLTGLRPEEPGHARLATDRIIDALTAELVGLRPEEPDTPRHLDPSRPVDLTRRHRSRR